MTKLKLLVISLVFAFFGLWGGILYLGEVNGQYIEPVATSSPTPIPTPVPTPAPGVPTTLMIPKIGVQALVESVGLDQEGKMDVPKKDEDVAWYSLGYRPGEKGSAVLAGHLDRMTGAPAVFWDLAKLEVGDEIYVTDDKNITYKYVVEKKQKYVYNQVPLEEIFASSDSAILNLITCGGTFNQAARNYTHRTIVSARQVAF